MSREHADWYHLIPAHVHAIINTIHENGFICFVVGGAVRDLVMGKSPKDFDLVTNAKPEQVSQLFPKTLEIGKQFGITMVVNETPAGSHTTEVATFRNDGAYLDMRRPEGIIYATPEEDALRRDFTMNGLFWDLEKDEIIDYVGGMADIANRRIRCIGDPEKRFQEDALRMLRALRFASQLAAKGFTIDKETMRALAKLCPNLMRVSRERITQEIDLILKSSKPSIALRYLIDLGMWGYWFGTASPSPQILSCIDSFSASGTYMCAWAGLFFECENFEQALNHFVLPRELKTCITEIIEDKTSVLEADKLEKADQKLLLHEGNIGNVLHFYITLGNMYEAGERRELGEAAKFCLAKLQEFNTRATLNPPPLIQGKDIIAMGFPPGPRIRQALDLVRRAQLNENISSREEAEHLVRVFLGH